MFSEKDYKAPPEVERALVGMGWLMIQSRLYTVKEAAELFFQGKVSAREVNKLFHAGDLLGYRVGRTILIYGRSLEAYRHRHENRKPPAPDSGAEVEQAPPPPRPRGHDAGPIPQVRLKRLPKE